MGGRWPRTARCGRSRSCGWSRGSSWWVWATGRGGTSLGDRACARVPRTEARAQARVGGRRKACLESVMAVVRMQIDSMLLLSFLDSHKKSNRRNLVGLMRKPLQTPQGQQGHQSLLIILHPAISSTLPSFQHHETCFLMRGLRSDHGASEVTSGGGGGQPGFQPIEQHGLKSGCTQDKGGAGPLDIRANIQGLNRLGVHHHRGSCTTIPFPAKTPIRFWGKVHKPPCRQICNIV